MVAIAEVLYPFRLAPVFRTRIWGFQNLAPWFDYQTSGEPIGEVWLTGDKCVAETGPLAGRTLQQISADHGASLFGGAHAGEDFPLLVKILFPREKLSVQVHPDDALARKYGEPRGKTECWYALEAAIGASVALGLKPGVSTEQVAQAIEDHTLENLLAYLPVSAGDMIFVDAGTVHAILPGAVILETQQNSDLTYRIYDYGRPRELHLDKAFAAMRSGTRAGKVTPQGKGNHTTLIDENYFRVDRFVLEGRTGGKDLDVQDNGRHLQILFLKEGTGQISGEGFHSFSLDRCQVAVIPASTGAWEMDSEGTLDLIRMIPQQKDARR